MGDIAQEKPSHHQVKVVRINEILPHLNADALEIIKTLGYQTVVRKGEYKVGQLAYFVPPDSIVPIKPEYSFLWESKVLSGEEPTIKQRRITAKRLRGSWSEGLLMPLETSLDSRYIRYNNDPDVRSWLIYGEGDDVSGILGIEHYNPPDPEDLKGENERGPKSPYPKSIKGWMYYIWYRVLNSLGFDTPLRGTNETGPKNNPPYYDIENYKHHVNAFQEGEEVWVSEKIHGCQGKYVYQNKHMYAGSRRMWKSTKSKCVWRRCLEQNPWIEEWCRNNEGFTLYGELFPVQGEKFMYGCKPGELKFLVFDVITPRHEWLAPMGLGKLCLVPNLYFGPFDEVKIKSLAEGKSTLCNKTIREGVVVKPIKERHVYGLGRLKLKIINNEYLSKGE